MLFNNLLPDLNDLYFFCLVVEKGSFTQASQELEITKSKLSRRISELESHLGVRLLYRSTRKLSLTDIGQLVYEHSKAMVSEANSAHEVALKAQTKPKGRIRITCPALFTQSEFNKIIIHFMQMYPEVRIHLEATDRKVDLIEEGFDIALRFQTNSLSDSNLVTRKLGESVHCLVASPHYLSQHPVTNSPTVLSNHAWLGKSRADGTNQLSLKNNDGQETNVSLTPLIESNDWTILKQGALAGLGFALLPQEICRQELNEGTLTRILPDWSLPTASLYLIYPSRRGLIPAVRQFIDFAGEEIGKGCAELASRLSQAFP
ncbi:LysR family transcriptional regulator [Legionella hackeliae]|uniref:LysR family transcriptional regulator n=2 Tax=Legionella hackeliae TaxID=449 RepID=A0A0A8UKA8_LEGHA|nr:LysR family transcriptional regulator [Legionella hackeliae]CEK09310.1 LysR family transcriptional regulator [Legionella hackeliae]STX49215.1 LysR family transcriptional regulator [Legionella hackeliae]